MSFELERMASSKSRACAVLVAFAAVLMVMLLAANPAWAAAELTVNKTGPGSAVAGDEITYTIVVTNTGDAPALLTELTDDLPAQTTFVSVETTEGTCASTPDPTAEVECELGTLDPDESATVTITARARTSGTAVNEACAQTTPPLVDPTLPAEGVCDTARTTIVPNLEIDKIDDRDPINVGGNILYTLRVTNIGGGDANDVVVIDELPIGDVRLVSVDSNFFECDPLDPPTGRIRCTSTGTLGPGDTASIKITVDPDEAGTITNTATVGAPGRAVIDSDTETTTVKDGGGGDGGGGDGGGGDGTGDGDGGATASTGEVTASTGDGVVSAGGVSLSCEQLISLAEDGGADAAQYSTVVAQKCEGSANVITGTVPGGTLANTGGPPFWLLVASLLLVGGGLLVRATLRR